MIFLTLYFASFTKHVAYNRSGLAKELRHLRSIGASIWKDEDGYYHADNLKGYHV